MFEAKITTVIRSKPMIGYIIRKVRWVKIVFSLFLLQFIDKYKVFQIQNKCSFSICLQKSFLLSRRGLWNKSYVYFLVVSAIFSSFLNPFCCRIDILNEDVNNDEVLVFNW